MQRSRDERYATPNKTCNYFNPTVLSLIYFNTDVNSD
jgi:hypothetical protein